MLRVTTLYAASAVATAAYYTRYLADAPGEVPGRWSGHQADALDVSGRVDADHLQRLLEGRQPVSGDGLGAPLKDRETSGRRVVKAVAGFDATFSAPKSVSVWWRLTGDPGVLDAHDLAVQAALDHLERYGATTRIRHAGRRLHPDTGGLTVASFRQTTSRADDPQLHTHAVISAKVRTEDGRWLAVDARFLKRHERMLGGLYQSVLRAELSHRYGIAWEPTVNGQAEIAGVPAGLLAQFSKRTVQVEEALALKVTEFRTREGRDPSRWERAAMEREAAADSRTAKTGHAVDDLAHRWREEALEVGWSPERFTAALTSPSHDHSASPAMTVDDILDRLSTAGSTWTRADATRAVCDVVIAPVGMSGQAWAAEMERRVDDVLAHCVDLDPDSGNRRRVSDGRSVWLEPSSPHYTSAAVVDEEEHILTWAAAAQDAHPQPSATGDLAGLDVLQGDAAAGVAGTDRLVMVVGPAGTGKTTMLRVAVDDLEQRGRRAFGVAPTAKAAYVLAAGTGMDTDTVAKLLHEWQRPGGPIDRYRLPAGATLVVDEAGMVGTRSLHHLVALADRHRWRLVLVGDPRQLQAVGRGGLFTELCRTSRVHELTRVHRFTRRWEADASLQFRAGNPDALDHYQHHDRIRAGTLDAHLEEITDSWLTHTAAGHTVAVTASSNDHVDTLNHRIQQARLAAGQLEPATAVPIAAGERAHLGELVVTRRNERDLVTSSGETVRNREQWTVIGIHPDGGLTLTRDRATVSVPVGYVRHHVRLGYAATEHGHQGDTVDIAIALTSPATTHRGLYVAATRGRGENRVHVITNTPDLTEARDTLEAILAHDRADIPAVTQRRQLAATDGPERPEPRLAWLDAWRHDLAVERRHLLVDTEAVAARCHNALRELDALQPELTAARVAWRPYERAIRRLEDEDRRAAAGPARRGLLRRARTERQLIDTDEAALEARRAIAELKLEGAPALDNLEQLQSRAASLRAAATPDRAVETRRARRFGTLDELLGATDSYLQWRDGRPVTPERLAHAVEVISTVGADQPDSPGSLRLDQARWQELLDLPLHELPARPARHPEIGLP